MTNHVSPGDRVRVTFEGTYQFDNSQGLQVFETETGGAVALDLDGARAIEILPPPEPPIGTVIIGFEREDRRDQWVFERERDDEDHGWRTTGVGVWHTYARVLELTKYDRRTIESTPR